MKNPSRFFFAFFFSKAPIKYSTGSIRTGFAISTEYFGIYVQEFFSIP